MLFSNLYVQAHFRKKVKLFFLFITLWFNFIHPLFAQITWYPHTTIPGMSLKRLIPATKEVAWIGVYNGAKTAKPFFYLQNGKWLQDTTFPMNTFRTFVADAFSPTHLWVCGYAPNMTRDPEDMGKLYLFDGKTWQLKIEGISWAKCMDVVALNELWIGFNGGQFLHIKDKSYEVIPLDLPAEILKVSHIYDMVMLNPQEGWACGANGLLAHYKDHKWQVIPPAPELAGILFEGMDIAPDDSVWVTGEKGCIASYQDGKWTRFPTPGTMHLFAIDMTSAAEGWCVGGKGTILHFQDKHWIPQPSPTYSGLFDVQMEDSGEGWICGEGVILRAVKGDYNLFRNITFEKSRIMNLQNTSQIAAIDLDGNKYPEIHFVNNHLFKNNGNQNFFEISDISGLPLKTETTDLGESAWGDTDNDGDLDLFQMHYAETLFCRIYENRNKGIFRIAKNIGDFQPDGDYSNTTGFVDFDNDGDLDLYIVQPYRSSQIPGHFYLYENTGYGHYKRSDQAIKSPYSNDLALWGDLDNDGDQDLVLLIGFKIFLNDGKGKLTEYPESLAGIISGMPVNQALLFDEDLDGDLDLFTVIDYPYLFRNDGKGFFDPEKAEVLYTNAHKTTNYASMLCSSGDIDNDGLPEICFLQQLDGQMQLFILKKKPDGTYLDIAPYMGFSQYSGNQALLQDMDNDGDLDFYLTNYENNINHFLENRANNQKFLKIRVRGITSNTHAVGAAILVYKSGSGGVAGRLTGYQQIGVGGNPRCINNLDYLHFGLPQTGLYDIQVIFPGGRKVIRNKVSSGSIIDIFEYPVPLRYWHLFSRQVQRALYFTVPWLELLKLALLAAIFFKIRLVLARRSGAHLFAARWYTWGLLVGCYTLAMIFLAGADPWISHGLPVTLFLLLFTAIWLLDAYLSRWRKERFLGPYRLGERLGEGGMGIVYKARNIATRRNVALKVLRPGFIAAENHKHRFAREGKLMQSLDHPHIVQVYETGEFNGRGFISLELLSGKTLGQLIRELGRIELVLLARVLIPVCDALSYIHAKGIIHRDIKSDNIFLLDVPGKQENSKQWLSRVTTARDSAKPFPVRLMDFGLARDASLLTITRVQGLLGTVVYMSPEQVKGEDLDYRTDLFSLGVVIYEALTGQLPFHGEHEIAVLQAILTQEPALPSTLNNRLPAGLDTLLTGLLSKKKEGRYANLTVVKQSLTSLQGLASTPATDAEMALQLSYKGLQAMATGSREEALALSSRAVTLARQGRPPEESRQIFYNHYLLLKSRGEEQQADGYIKEAYHSLLQTGENLFNDNLNQEIFGEYKIRELTRLWQAAYTDALSLQAGGDIHAASLKLRECIHTIYETLFILHDEDKKQEYIKQYMVENILLFNEQLTGNGR